MNSKIRSLSAARSALVVLLLGLSATLATTWYLERANQQQVSKTVASAANKAADDIVARIRRYQYGLRGVRGAVVTAGENGITRELFRRYGVTREIDKEFPGATAFGFVRRVAAGADAGFLARARADGLPSFAIQQLTPNSGERYVIQYTAPGGANNLALGLDIASESNRREAARSSMLTGETRLTGPIALLQRASRQKQSFLLLMPMYRTASTPETQAEREAEAFGWSFAVLSMDDVLAGINIESDAARMTLVDITDPAHPEPFFRTDNENANDSVLETRRVERNVFGRRWQIDFAVQEPFVQHLHLISPRLVATIGVLGSLLLAALAGVAGLSRQRKSQIAAEQARLAAIVESSVDGIIGKSLTGIVTSWNKGAEAIFGYTAEKAVGRALVDLTVPDDLLDEEADILSRVAAGERIAGLGTRRRGSDGGLLHVALTGSPILGSDGNVIGSSMTVRDISAQKYAEARILELNSNLEGLVKQRTAELLLAAEAAELGVWTWNLGDGSLSWNARMFDIYGLAKGSPGGSGSGSDVGSDVGSGGGNGGGNAGGNGSGITYEHWLARVHPDDRDATVQALQSSLPGQAGHRLQFRIVLDDGSVRHIQARTRIERDASGKAIRVTGINRDITDQTDLEFHLRNAKLQADAASAAKSSFLANMSHEIRTPMNAVLGMLQLVQKTELNSRQLDYVHKAHTAAKSLLGLLNDILDYSKIEAGKLQLDPHPFELEPLMRELAVILTGNQGDKPVEVMFDLDTRLPESMIGDSLRLQQVLINLAGNALKFTLQGQVVVAVQRIELAGEDDGTTAHVRISVTDSGIGITAEQLGRIFEGFNQAEASTTRRFGGSGLGLAICKRIVQLMGGQLEVESEPGKGSRFWFDLALAVAPAASTAAASAPVGSAASMPSHAHHFLRVLVVDDNPISGELLVRTAQSIGWHADLADGGQAAIDTVTAHHGTPRPYDLVLMDWNMPVVDGLAAANAIRRLPASATRPVIIMITAHGSEILTDSRETGDAPFSGFLTKPITPGQLIGAVASAMQPGDGAVAQKATQQQRLAGMRLLVVEDNALNRQVADELLRAEGAHVELAEGGLEGVAKVIATPHAFDVVLMDVQMPDIDGLEATRRIRANADAAGISIVAMTANASMSDRAACLAAGMDDHVGKPIDVEQLVPVLLIHGPKADALATPAAAIDHASPTPAPDDNSIEATASVLRRFGGSAALVRTLLHGFQTDMDKQLAELSASVSARDTRRAIAALHVIKGTAGTMGTVGLALQAGRLETVLKRDGDPALARIDARCLDRLSTVLARGTAELVLAFRADDASAEGAEEETGTETEALTRTEWQGRLSPIVPLLDASNLQALDLAEDLAAHTPSDLAAPYERFLAEVRQLNFTDAAAIARQLLEHA